MCFSHFDFQMCCTPQPCALFQHLNFQKCCESAVSFNLLISTCASRHNSVQFLISHLPGWPRTCRFCEPTFRPSGATKHFEKTQCFATCLPFRVPASSFFFLSLLWSSSFYLSLLWLFPPLLFHLSILSDFWLLNFLWLTTSLLQVVNTPMNDG